MKWTKEQLDAISLSGQNIIVSAGAGSGKTAVLSERVLNKIDNGIHLNELLILTFTKAIFLQLSFKRNATLITSKDSSKRFKLNKAFDLLI